MARLPLKALEGVLRADGYQEIISSLFGHDFVTFSPWASRVRGGVCHISFSTRRTPFKTAPTFPGREGIPSGVVPSWGACSSPAPSRVRLVMHPLCKSSWKVFAMHEKELGCFWSTRARCCRVLQHHLLTSPSPSLSSTHTGVCTSSLAATALLEVINNTLLAGN